MVGYIVQLAHLFHGGSGSGDTVMIRLVIMNVHIVVPYCYKIHVANQILDF